MNITELSKVDNDGVTALTLAARQGKRVEKICELLIPKMNKQAFNHVDKDGNTPLICAANNYLDKVCEMLIPKMNAQGINYINNEGNTPLTIAADRELEKTCELLVNKMSNEAINQVTKDGNTVLTVAASKGLDKVCEALVPKMSEQAINAVVKEGFFKGHTALSIAKRHGFKNICDLLETHQKQIFSENNELTETVNKFFHDPNSVSFCYQQIDDDFAKFVADKLKVIKTITAIDFMGSTISDQGIKIITAALKVSTQIKKLDFNGCDLGDQKISVLAEVLQLKTLTHLCLSANYIGNVGINAMIEALKLNNTILYLELHTNNISHEEAKLIIKALKENTTITHIDLEQNNIDQQNKAIIAKYLQRNKNLLEEHNNFQKLIDGLNDKIANNTNINDKTKIAEQLKNIACKAKLLINKVNIEQVTNNLQDLLSKNKITKGNIIDLEDEINAIIDHQNIADDISISGADSSFI